MAGDVQEVFGPLCDFSDEWSHHPGLDSWVEHGGTDGGISDNSDSEFNSDGAADRRFWITAGSRKRLLKKAKMDSWKDTECPSDTGSDDSDDSVSIGYVRDRILRNVLMKSQAIESENRTLRKQLALYAYEFKRLRDKFATANSVEGEHVSSGWVSDLKSVVGMGHSTDLDDVLSRLKEVMAEFRIEEEKNLAGHASVDLETVFRCPSPHSTDSVGRRLKAFNGSRGKGRDKRGLARAIHRLRAELASTKEQLKELTSGAGTAETWYNSQRGGLDKAGVLEERQLMGLIRSALGMSHSGNPQSVLARISALKSESMACKQQLCASETTLSACSEELEATKLQVTALEQELSTLKEANDGLSKERAAASTQIARLRDNAIRWRQGLLDVAAQVHEMQPIADKINGFDVDGRLVQLRSDLTGAKTLLHRSVCSQAGDARGRRGMLRNGEGREWQQYEGATDAKRSIHQSKASDSGINKGETERSKPEIAPERRDRPRTRRWTL